jgi:uncharacterized membrane protein (UPF0127 family)
VADAVTPAVPPTPRPQLPAAVLPDGSVLTLELALTDEERSRGLMFRPSMAGDRGMLFVFPTAQLRSFWMKDTLIPLDIVYLDVDGSVVSVSADAVPCYEEPCPQYRSKGPAAAVLEVNAGVAAAHGIVPGVRLEFRRVPGYPLAAEGVTPPGSGPGS